MNKTILFFFILACTATAAFAYTQSDLEEAYFQEEMAKQGYGYDEDVASSSDSSSSDEDISDMNRGFFKSIGKAFRRFTSGGLSGILGRVGGLISGGSDLFGRIGGLVSGGRNLIGSIGGLFRSGGGSFFSKLGNVFNQGRDLFNAGRGIFNDARGLLAGPTGGVEDSDVESSDSDDEVEDRDSNMFFRSLFRGIARVARNVFRGGLGNILGNVGNLISGGSDLFGRVGGLLSGGKSFLGSIGGLFRSGGGSFFSKLGNVFNQGKDLFNAGRSIFSDAQGLFSSFSGNVEDSDYDDVESSDDEVEDRDSNMFFRKLTACKPGQMKSPQGECVIPAEYDGKKEDLTCGPKKSLLSNLRMGIFPGVVGHFVGGRMGSYRRFCRRGQISFDVYETDENGCEHYIRKGCKTLPPCRDSVRGCPMSSCPIGKVLGAPRLDAIRMCTKCPKCIYKSNLGFLEKKPVW